MNTQSLSSSLSLSQSFVNNYAGGNQPPKSGTVENNHPAVNPMRFSDDTYKSSQVAASNGSRSTGSTLPNSPIAFSKSKSMNLQIKTKEGDLVSISFNRLEAGHLGALKMSQNKNGVGGENQRNAFKSESNLNIDADFVKSAEKPISKPSLSVNTPNPSDSATSIKKLDTEVKNVSENTKDVSSRPSKLETTSRSELNTKQTETKINPPSVKDDFNKKPTAEIKQAENKIAKTDTSSSKVVDNTPNELAKANSRDNQAPTSFSRLVVSSRSVLHMEIGGNKLDATQEQNYSITPANSSSVNEGMNNYAQQLLQSQTSHLETEKPAARAPSQTASAHQVDELQLPTNEDNDIAQNAFQPKQSIETINGDGGHYSFGSDFNISIEGDLNEEEQQSIAELLQAMGKVSQDFFQDKVSSVFSQVQKMGFETEQIAGFSMNLNSQKSVQAVAAYQQTKMPDQNINMDVLNQASGFMAQAKETMANAKAAINSFAEPEKSFTDMFAGIGQMIYDENNADQQNDSGPMFLKMVENISSDLYSSSQMN